jgi:hypothetical protein
MTMDKQTLIEAILPQYVKAYQGTYTPYQVRERLENFTIEELQFSYNKQLAAGKIKPDVPKDIAARAAQAVANSPEAQENLRLKAALQQEAQKRLRLLFFREHPEYADNEANWNFLWNHAISLSENGSVNLQTLAEAAKNLQLAPSGRKKATSENYQHDEKTLRVYCEAHHRGFNQAALLRLRDEFGGEFSYQNIDDAISRQLINLGDPSESEEEKYQKDYAEWVATERVRLAKIICDSEQSWMMPDPGHLEVENGQLRHNLGTGGLSLVRNETGYNEAVAKISQWPLEQLQAKAQIAEHNKTLAGMSVGQLLEQRRKEHQTLAPALSRSDGYPTLPDVDETKGEFLTEDYFRQLWVTDRKLFDSYVRKYGASQVVERANFKKGK